MRKQRILICGATGFIGHNLILRFAKCNDIELLGTFYKTYPPQIEKVVFQKVDLRDARQVNNLLKNVDIVIQAAATTSGSKDILSQPYIHVTDNAVMNSLILRAAYENHVSHVVFLSCSVMYQPGEKPVKESDLNLTQEIYPSYFGVGWTKVYIEKMCEFYSRLGRTKHTVIRHSNIYGPYDKFDLEHSHVFGALMTKVLTAKEDFITLWGRGEAKRDLLYVEDLVDFIELVINKQQEPYELINVGFGSCISIYDLAQKIIRCVARNLKICFDDTRPSIQTQLCLDITKACKRFDWKPKVDLDRGIRNTINWYKENILENQLV